MLKDYCDYRGPVIFMTNIVNNMIMVNYSFVKCIYFYLCPTVM